MSIKKLTKILQTKILHGNGKRPHKALQAAVDHWKSASIITSRRNPCIFSRHKSLESFTRTLRSEWKLTWKEVYPIEIIFLYSFILPLTLQVNINATICLSLESVLTILVYFTNTLPVGSSKSWFSPSISCPSMALWQRHKSLHCNGNCNYYTLTAKLRMVIIIRQFH